MLYIIIIITSLLESHQLMLSPYIACNCRRQDLMSQSLRTAIRTGRLRESLESFQETFATLSGYNLRAEDRPLLMESRGSLENVSRTINNLSFA